MVDALLKMLHRFSSQAYVSRIYSILVLLYVLLIHILLFKINALSQPDRARHIAATSQDLVSSGTLRRCDPRRAHLCHFLHLLYGDATAEGRLVPEALVRVLRLLFKVLVLLL